MFWMVDCKASPVKKELMSPNAGGAAAGTAGAAGAGSAAGAAGAGAGAVAGADSVAGGATAAGAGVEVLAVLVEAAGVGFGWRAR